MNIAYAVLGAVFVGSTALSQVPPPSHESLLHHIFGPHRDAPNLLEQRSKSLSCALVLITAGNRTGTGFYVSADGDIATAAHVLGDKIFIEMPNSQFLINIVGSPQILIKSSGDSPASTYDTKKVVENNGDAWSADLALIKTGTRGHCWLRTQGDENVRTGQHVLSLGFPGLAFGSLTMYSGIVAGRLKTTLPMGKTVQGHPITSNVELVRIQMPISPGFSGAPLIDDENRVIGVVTSAGAWSGDLDLLLQWERVRETTPQQAPANGVEPLALVGELAEMFHDYGSPGYGDAVPMHYLRKVQVANQPPATPVH